MQEKSIRIRLSQKRYDKLKLYAESQEKTVTQLVGGWINRLSSTEIDDFSTTPRPNQPRG